MKLTATVTQIAPNGGRMLVLNNTSECSRYLMKQGYLSLHAITRLFCMCATWSTAVNGSNLSQIYIDLCWLTFQCKVPPCYCKLDDERYWGKIGCAYDIGCSFHKTLSHSCLGPRVQASEFCLMVGAFHGYAHDHGCQLDWHPLYMKGTGCTEGEGCEHIFSSSNDLARNTCHSRGFHCHQAITDHFQFWDQDKYALLSKCATFISPNLEHNLFTGMFIANHYHQAVQIIEELEHDLEHCKDCHERDFSLFQFLFQRHSYLFTYVIPQARG